MLNTRLAVLLSCAVLSLVLVAPAQSQSQPAIHTIRVDVTPGHATNSFVPTQTLGAGIDRLPAGAIDKLINPATLSKVLSAGWQPVSYRQNTELFVEAWHWNPQGTWSDAAGKGYFTGSTTPAEPIQHSYGYPLPHRGFTRNDGTGNDGYSRLTDGDLNSYWKSNPYLTKAFTGEDDSLHPQWVIVDLANPQQVNAIRIAWAEPYARRYTVQYWTGDDPIKHATAGVWQTFLSGAVNDSKGGDVTLQLAPSPIPVRYVRVLMTESSNTCDTHGSADRRNCVGYAMKELFLGTSGTDGEFHDLLRHTPDQDQSATYCSSVDPWHEASDIDPKKRDQVGFDLFYTSGYTRGLPAIVPIALLYDIPENAANEIAYLKKRGYPVSYVEMGEEADGQYMLPEDYAALYIQWAAAIHKADPSAKLGGPSFQGVNEDIQVWPDAEGRTSWTGRFINYLKTHGRLSDLAFFSFEHYPLEPCKIQWSSLYDEARLVTHITQVWKADGVPNHIPMLITESNIAWQSAENSVDIFGALWLADYIGAYLTAGGNGVYYFHYMPLGMHHGCADSYGTFGLFTVNSNLEIQQPTSQFFASQLINLEWVQPGNGSQQVFPAASDVADEAGNVLVTSYAVLRPDGQWSLMLINKDQWNPHPVHIAFHDESANADSYFTGPVTLTTFGSAQYQWHPTAKGGFAEPDGPAAVSTTTALADTLYSLPAASITVVRGKIAGK
ncbi:MAG TPA: discoidin domain-containing protein [Terriglobales bacterium]|nr:discoidin domain-containing protein [Terriglobales bacterium]